MAFGEDFVWGAAAAAYQIEGAVNVDGRGLSVWDAYCRQPGAVLSGDTGDIACDHYHRYREDVAMMREIGLRAYRLSISWPRVLPSGAGKINDRGIAFYDKLVDALLAAGIEPWVTLFHWDFPLDLYYRGGWLNRKSPNWFADYAAVVVDALSDRVRHWLTLNEPQCFIHLGHGAGSLAPGLKLSMQDQLLAAHHALIAHGRAVQTIRERAKTQPSIGFAPVNFIKYPTDATPEVVEAAYQATMSFGDASTLLTSTWFSDPALLGHYPEDGLDKLHRDLPEAVRNNRGDLEVIRQPLDFYGVNMYDGRPLALDETGRPHSPELAGDHPRTLFDWPVTPEILRWGPRFLQRRYRLPIYITENGLSNPDWVGVDGCCHDPQRIDFLKRYLRELSKANDEGADVRGYFHWSILDNFEWSYGYRHRFGLIHVDYRTQKRTPKDSAHWYSNLISENGCSLGS